MGVGGRADGRVGRPVGEEKQKALVTVSRVVVMIVIIIAFFYFLIVLPPPPPSLLFFLSALGGVPPFLPCHAILAGCLVPSPHRLPLLWLVFMCVCIHLVTWFPRGVAYLTIGSGRQVETHTHTHTHRRFHSGLPARPNRKLPVININRN